MLNFLMAALVAAFSISSPASTEESNFLDQIIAHHTEVNQAVELVQEKSSNLDLKRMTRKIRRKNKRELEKLYQWREAYFEKIPEKWIVPSKELSELKSFQGVDFDLEFLRRMMIYYQQGKKLLIEIQGKTKKGFILTFAINGQKHFEKHLKKMYQLQRKILGT